MWNSHGYVFRSAKCAYEMWNMFETRWDGTFLVFRCSHFRFPSSCGFWHKKIKIRACRVTRFITTEAWKMQKRSAISRLSCISYFRFFMYMHWLYLGSFNENRVVDEKRNSWWNTRQSRKWLFLGYFWCFFANFDFFCGWEATFWSGNHILSPQNIT